MYFYKFLTNKKAVLIIHGIFTHNWKSIKWNNNIQPPLPIPHQ